MTAPSTLGLPPVATIGVTTVAQLAFTHSARTGDLAGVRPGGFFLHDVRHLSRLDVRIDDAELTPIDMASVDPSRATFVLRAPDRSSPDDGTGDIVVVRTRTQHDNRLQERIEVTNRGRIAHDLQVRIVLDADFATMLDLLLAGGPRPVDVTTHHDGHDLRLVPAEGAWDCATVVHATGSQHRPDGSGWVADLALEPGESWHLDLAVTAHVADQDELDAAPARAGDEPSRPAVTPIGPAGTPVPAGDAGSTAESASVPRLRSNIPGIDQSWQRSLIDLHTLEHAMFGERVTAAGVPWFVTLFGRDSLISALQTMLVDRGRALGTARALARVQGTTTDPTTAQEPGKILHEVRHPRPGSGRHEADCHYETIDATPLYCILAERLWRWDVDAELLAPVLDATDAALGWVLGRLDRDDLLFYEHGETRLVHHGWKDSRQPIVDADGQDLTGPIAVVEAQGYAVAALRAGAELARAGLVDRRPADLEGRAAQLERRIEDVFRCADPATAAMAVDADLRSADVASSNAGHLLWAGAAGGAFADDIAASLRSDDLWTGFGIRTLDRHNPAHNPMSYHRGSVWPHDTALCMAGLARSGHADQARAIADGLLAAAPRFGYQLPELFCGFDRARVPLPIRFPTSSSPQAWAAGVPVQIVQHLLGLESLGHGSIGLSPGLAPDEWIEVEGLPLAGGTLSLRVEGTQLLDASAPDGVEVTLQ